MIRKLKALGLGLVALLAMAALAAPIAAAEEEHTFIAAAANTVLTGHGENHVFTVEKGGIRIVCETVNVATTITGEEQDEWTLHPRYSEECAIEGTGVEGPIFSDGCNYILDSDTIFNEHKEEDDAPVTLECEEGYELRIVLPQCVVHFTPGTYQGARFVQEGEGATKYLVVTATVTTVKYIAEGLLCAFVGIPEGVNEDGAYEGVFTVRGYKDEGVIKDNETVTTSNTTVGYEYNDSLHVAIGYKTP